MSGYAREHSLIEELFAEGLQAVEPRTAVKAAMHLDGDDFEVAGRRLELTGRVVVLAIGKAAVPMAEGCRDVLGSRIETGIILTKDGHLGGGVPGFEAFEARHPLPDERGIAATQHILSVVQDLTDQDVVIALISGGGSALLEAPLDGISLEDFQRTTDVLLRAGAPIQHLNAVRSTISKVKGGGLRRVIGDATCVSLILSDVLGNDPAVIASGPTIPATPDADRALALLDQYGVTSQIPGPVLDAMKTLQGRSEPAPEHSGDIWHIVGDNRKLLDRIRESAEARHLSVETAWQNQEGEARELGREFVALAQGAKHVDLLLGGGEATVTVSGDGSGGRNTEFALAVAIALDEESIADWVVASLGSDGQDGSVDAAGAIADASTVKRAAEQGLDAADYLARNDSGSFFAALDDLVTPGPTGTNVNDVYLAVRVRRS